MAKKTPSRPGRPQQPSGKPASTGPKPAHHHLFDPFQAPPIGQRRWETSPEIAGEVRALANRAKMKLWTAAILVAVAGVLVGVVYLLMFLSAEGHADAFLRSEHGRGLGIEQGDLAWAMQGVFLTAAIVGGAMLILGALMLKWPITCAAIAFVLFLIPQVIMVAMVGPTILFYEWYWPAAAIVLLVASMLVAHSGKQDRLGV